MNFPRPDLKVSGRGKIQFGIGRGFSNGVFFDGSWGSLYQGRGFSGFGPTNVPTSCTDGKPSPPSVDKFCADDASSWIRPSWIPKITGYNAGPWYWKGLSFAAPVAEGVPDGL